MKMKKMLPLLVGIVVFALLIGGYAALKNKNENAQTSEEDAPALYSYALDDLTEASFTDKHGNTLTFAQGTDGWTYAEDKESCQVLEEPLSELLNKICTLSASDTIDLAESGNTLSDYGLEAPENQITLKTKDASVSVSIGGYNDTTACQYVTLDGNTEKIYAVSVNLTGAFKVDIFDLIAGENFPVIDETSIKKVTYNSNGETKDLSSDMWSELATMSFNNYVDYNCTDFSKYGLHKPWLILEIAYTENIASDSTDEDGQAETETREVKTVVEFGTEYKDEETNQVCYYVRLKDSKEVHSITKEKMAALFQGANVVTDAAAEDSQEEPQSAEDTAAEDSREESQSAEDATAE